MSEKTVPVIAAIPSYNMAESLIMLLPDVLKQNYDHVYVLDDASTDNTIQVVEGFGNQVTLIQRQENGGPGAARNQILEDEARHLGNSILHFIDADVRLDSHNNPQAARRIFTDSSVGLAGGLIKLPNGKQWMFNFGARYSFYSLWAGKKQVRMNQLMQEDPLTAKEYSQKNHFWLKSLPNILEPPAVREVFWAGEANMLVPYRLFKQVGGFDPKLRYHEVQDLAIKLHKLGYKTIFDPSISVIHPAIDLEAMNRRALESKAGLAIIYKYGPRIK